MSTTDVFKVVPLQIGFPYDLSQEAIEALTDPKQRQIFERLLRTHRAVLAQQRRCIHERLLYLDGGIAKCDWVIELLDPDPNADI